MRCKLNGYVARNGYRYPLIVLKDAAVRLITIPAPLDK